MQGTGLGFSCPSCIPWGCNDSIAAGKAAHSCPAGVTHRPSCPRGEGMCFDGTLEMTQSVTAECSTMASVRGSGICQNKCCSGSNSLSTPSLPLFPLTLLLAFLLTFPALLSLLFLSLFLENSSCYCLSPRSIAGHEETLETKENRDLVTKLK